MQATVSDPTTKSRRRFFRRYFKIFACFVVIVFLWGYWYFHDGPPPNDKDLVVSIKSITDKENAYVALINADLSSLDFAKYADEHSKNPNDGVFVPDDIKQNPALVEAFLKQAAPDLAKIDEVMLQDKFHILQASISDEPWHPENIDHLRQAWKMDCDWAQSVQHWDEAFASTKRLLNFSQKFAKPDLVVDEYKEAMDMEVSGLQSSLNLLNDPLTPPTVIEALRGLLPPSDMARNGLKQTLRLCYTIQKRSYADLDNMDYEQRDWALYQGATFVNTPITNFMISTFQPNKTLTELNGIIRDQINALDSTFPIWAERMNEFFSSQNWHELFERNLGGRIYINELLEKTSGYLRYIPYEVDGINAVTRTALATRLYWNDHGKLPADIDELVPQYLAKFPQDPFDGRLIEYDPAQGTIWSRGNVLMNAYGMVLDTAHAHPELLNVKLIFTEPQAVNNQGNN